MKIALIIIVMLLLFIVVTLIKYYPSYKWNNTCRKLFDHFENGVLDKIHDLIDTMEEDIFSRSFEQACIDKLDEEFTKFKMKYTYFIDNECLKGHYRTYRNDITNHIMRRKNKIAYPLA